MNIAKYLLAYIFSSVCLIIISLVCGLLIQSTLSNIIYKGFIDWLISIVGFLISIFLLKKLLPFLIADKNISFSSASRWRMGNREILFFVGLVAGFYALCKLFAFGGLLSFEPAYEGIQERIFPIAVFLLLLFLAAFLEEYLFRHLLFKHFPPSWTLILINAIFFSLVHFPSQIIAFIYLFLGAVIYCLMYLKTQNFVYPALLHYAKNFSLWFYGVLFLENEDTLFFEKMTEDVVLFWNIESTNIIQFIFSVIILVLVLLYKRKQFDLWRLCFREEKSLG